MKNINIAELLKDCPKGMELDCTMYNSVTLLRVNDEKHAIFPIKVLRSDGCEISLTEYGQYAYMDDSKCVIFPKGKTTWEGFTPPCKFKDGDILATDLGSVFFLNTRLNTDEYYGCFVGKGGDGSFHICEPFAYKECCGLATEEEKTKLFQAIKDNGYHWNAETKTLEKLAEPSFKVGDKIRHITYTRQINVVTGIKDTHYILNGESALPFICQEEYELIPTKFDITTLKPFESKVLIRDYDDKIWIPAFWGKLLEDDFYCRYLTTNGCYKYCIPYKGNEYLLGTTNDCNEFYKTWEL